MSIEEVYQHFLDEDAVFIDTRPIDNYNSSHIPGAIWITVGNVTNNLHLLPDKGDLIITYCDCSTGGTAYVILKELENEGYTNITYLDGTFTVEWKENGYPVESGLPLFFSKMSHYYQISAIFACDNRENYKH
jgi:rhodanese-related sulfurtransferase